MFRRIAIIALSLATLRAVSQSQDPLFTATPQQLAAVKVVLAQEAAWNRGDLDAFVAHYKDAPEAEAVLGNHVKGYNNIRAAFHLNYPNRDAMGTIEYTGVEAIELGEKFSLATGRYHLERAKKSGGSAEGTFTEVLEKTAAGWRVIFSETT